MSTYTSNYMARLRAAVRKVTDLSHLADWICNNTSHPKDNSKSWSFKDHEYQIAILNDGSRDVSVRKCSQVGMSELSVRMTLAMLDVMPNTTAIYTLPTTSFARKFTKARIDPVIANSEQLRTQMNKETDSSELKQVGYSFLYIAGSYGQNSAISVPADILINDEVDFSNQKALSTFNSRLGHAEGGGYKRRFSTPTVEGYGISKDFEVSTQARYMVRHDVCGQLVAPDPLAPRGMELPGFDGVMHELEKEDLESPVIRWNDIKLLCPACNKPITAGNLAESDKREWVHEFPDREKVGYQIMPFDVPSVNPFKKSVRAIDDYDRKADWINFEFGLPFEDAETSFIADIIDKMTLVIPVQPGSGVASGCVAGLDVGKVSWLAIGKRIDAHTFDVIWLEQIRETGEAQLRTTVLERLKQFGVQKLVVDAMPDFSTALGLIAESYAGQVYACYYTRNQKKTKLTNIDTNDVEQIVQAYRTGTFDAAAKAVNTGYVRFPRHDQMLVMKEHLRAMKRVKHQTASGDMVADWVKTGPEHYAHSLNYLLMADKLCDHMFSGGVIATLPMASKTRFGAKVEEEGTSLIQTR